MFKNQELSKNRSNLDFGFEYFLNWTETSNFRGLILVKMFTPKLNINYDVDILVGVLCGKIKHNGIPCHFSVIHIELCENFDRIVVWN